MLKILHDMLNILTVFATVSEQLFKTPLLEVFSVFAVSFSSESET